MPSLLPGFEYDIFISYRHNDNRSGWVTAFAENLSAELSAAIKDPVSVYFDTNPSDGLLESHNVDKSLEGKLKCLIFIPIISQTYCDPKSFAWKHEFLAFNNIAKGDPFGRDVKLPTGNVASRILPVKIHDLDAEDKLVLEKELGGVLRSIEFIYKSSGVNRPLRAHEDHPRDNLNKTYYLDQINKVSNAVKEIIAALRNGEGPEMPSVRPVSDGPFEKRIASKKGRWAVFVGVILGILLAVYLIYSSSSPGGVESNQPKSIAVLPFENLSGDKEQEYFSDGMMEEIINQLVKIRELSVTSQHSSMVYKDSSKPLKSIAKELGVVNILEGRVQRSGDKVRVAVQLIDARTEKNLWSESFVRDVSDVFSIQSDISKNIASELQAVLSIHDVENLNLVPTTSKEAYDFFLRSLYYERKDDWIKGIEMCNKAIALDPKFTLAYVLRASWNGTHFFNKWPTWEGRDQLAKADIEKAVQLNPDMPEVKIGRAMTLFYTERKYDSAIRILSEVLKDRPNDVQVYYWLGTIQRRQGLWQDAQRNLDKAVSMDPSNTNILIRAAYLHYVLRHYAQAIEYANRALSIDPEVGTAGLVVYRSLLCWKGDVKAANNAIVYNSDGARLESISDSMRLEWARLYYSRQFGDLLKLNDKSKSEITEDQNHYEPTALRAARIHYLNGNLDASKEYARKAVGVLNDRLTLKVPDYRIYSALGYAYAFAGNKREAVAFGKKGNELMPVELDAFSGGLTSEQSLAEIYIITGDYDLAMDRIEHLLSIPGDLSVQLLNVDPMFDKLRPLARFKRITDKVYKSNY